MGSVLADAESRYGVLHDRKSCAAPFCRNGEKKVGPIKLRVGQPFREYYQTRDALYLLQENYVPLKMRLRLIANVTIRPVVHYLMLDDKRAG